MIIDAIKESGSAGGWIVCETRHHAHVISRKLSVCGYGTWRALPFGDVLAILYRRLVQGDKNQGCFGSCESEIVTLSEFSVNSILYGLINKSHTEFPLLSADMQSVQKVAGRSINSYLHYLKSIKRFIDTVRAYDLKDGTIRAVVDECGTLRGDKARTAELICLLDAFLNYCDENNYIDSIGVAEKLFEVLCSVDVASLNYVLPEALLFVRPTTLCPLESLIIFRLAQISHVNVLVDERIFNSYLMRDGLSHGGKLKMPPSIRSAVSVAKTCASLLTSKAKVSPVKTVNGRRAVLAEVLFDGKPIASTDMTSADLSNIFVWECRTKEEEVRQVFLRIRELLKNEGVEPEDIQVIALSLDSYADIAISEAYNCGVPIYIGKGFPLWRTGSANCFLSLLKWTMSPSVSTGKGYFESKLVRPKCITTDMVVAFREVYADFLKSIYDSLVWQAHSAEIENIFSDKSSQIANHAIDWSLVDAEFRMIGCKEAFESLESFAAGVLGYYKYLFSEIKGATNTFGRFETKKELIETGVHFLFLVRSLSGILQELKWVQTNISCSSVCNDQAVVDFSESLLAIKTKFLSERISLRELYSASIDMRYGENVYRGEMFAQWLIAAQGYRSIRRIVKDIAGALNVCGRLSSLFVKDLFGKDLVNEWSAVCGLLIERIEGSYVTFVREDESVAITELLDARGICNKHTFVLGTMSSLFPVSGKHAHDMGPSADLLALDVRRHAGEASPVFESYLLIGQVLNSLESVVFSYPREDASGEQSPAGFLERLVACGAIFKGVDAFDYDSHDYCSNENNSNKDNVRPVGKALISGRDSIEFNAFDGVLGADIHGALVCCNKDKFLPNGDNCYSVTSLEVLSDCPHRFFFSQILGLERAKVTFVDEVHRYKGMLVHKALELFFREPRFLSMINGASDEFDDACREMQKLVLSLADNGRVDWNSHPRLKAAFYSIVSGLEIPSSEEKNAKIGLLKTALQCQRMRLDTDPHILEYHFGKDKNDWLRVACKQGVDEQRTEQCNALIGGVIDRIDVLKASILENVSNSDRMLCAIWDYKTGKAASFGDVLSGKSLQIPIYAAAVMQNFGQRAQLVRGGCLVLGERISKQKTSADVIVEHLGIVKNGRQYELDASAVHERINDAIKRVGELDSLVRKGDFSQILDTDKCDICDFRTICARNEANLCAKMKAKEEAVNKGVVNAIEVKGELLAKSAQKQILPHMIDVQALRAQGSCGNVKAFKLSDEQEKAADISKNVCLIASAGSGKTAVLRTRVLRLLQKGVSLDSILAITFTEKAAREIRERIYRALLQILESNTNEEMQLSIEERERFIEAFACISEAQFGTIHSFASNVVQMDLVLAGIGSYSRVLSKGEQIEMLHKVMQDVIDGHAGVESALYGDVSKDVEFLLNNGIAFGQLLEEIQALVLRPKVMEKLSVYFGDSSSNASEPDFWKSSLGEILTDYAAIALQKSIDAHASDLREWIVATNEWIDLKNKDASLEESKRIRFDWILEQAKGLLNNSEIRQNPDFWRLKLLELAEYLKKEKSASVRRSKNNPRNFWLELENIVLSLIENIGSASENAQRLSISLCQALYRLSYKVANHFTDIKASLGVVDFDDLIGTAHRMICSQFADPALLARQKRLIDRLQKRFYHVMIDEFQDTDPFQWEFLSKLFLNDEVEDAVSSTKELFAERSLFIVGDAQQAIYSFREGDVRVFRQAVSDIVSKKGVELNLVNNYRSGNGIVTFINALFAQIFSADWDDAGKACVDTAVVAEPMIAKRSEDFGNTVLALPLAYDREDPLENRGLQREARNVASFVSNVLADYYGDCCVWPGLKESSMPVVAILTRRVRELFAIADELKVHGVPFSISHSAGFFELQEIIQFEHLLHAMSCFEDSISLVGVLRSAIFGLSDRQLVELYCELDCNWANLWNECWQRKQYGLLSGEATNGNVSARRLAIEITAKLQKWKLLASILPTSKFLQGVIFEQGVFESYKQLDKLECVCNIERFISVLYQSELERSDVAGVSGALKWLLERRYDSSGAPNANASTHPVVLTTVHGAKGLEYPMVILPFLGKSRGRDNRFTVGEIDWREFNKSRDSGRKFFMSVKVQDSSRDYKTAKTLLGAQIEHLNKQRAVAEERRIFYVACTRARDYLILSMPESRDFINQQDSYKQLSKNERIKEIRKTDKALSWLQYAMDLNTVDFNNNVDLNAIDPDKLEDGNNASMWRVSDERNGQDILVPIVRMIGIN